MVKFFTTPKVLEVLTVKYAKQNELLHIVSTEIPLAEIQSKKMANFVKSMILTAESATTPDGYSCVGLSAIQVGVPLRMFVKIQNIDSQVFNPYFNPQFEVIGVEAHARFETCMSIPGKRIEKTRASKIRFTYIDAKGQQQSKICEGFMARIVQHEVDHLNGVLISD